MKELNDPEATIPAFHRFQKQDKECKLRSDIRPLKEKHFRNNYNKELGKPKDLMKKVAFQKQKCDSNKYYELKYFLTPE